MLILLSRRHQCLKELKPNSPSSYWFPKTNYSFAILLLSILLLTTAVCKCSYIVTILSRITSSISFLSRSSLNMSIRSAKSDKIWSILPCSKVNISLFFSSSDKFIFSQEYPNNESLFFIFVLLSYVRTNHYSVSSLNHIHNFYVLSRK